MEKGIRGGRYEDREGRREVWRRRYREAGTGNLKLPVLDDLFTCTNLPKLGDLKPTSFSQILNFQVWMVSFHAQIYSRLGDLRFLHTQRFTPNFCQL